MAKIEMFRLRKRDTTSVIPFSLLLVTMAQLLVGFFAPRLHAEPAAYALVDADSGFVLDARNGNRRLAPASLVKVAAAMVVLDWLEASGRSASEQIAVPPAALAHGGANPVGLQAGDRASIRDLLYAALMASDNTAMSAVAAHVGRDLLARGGRGNDPFDAFVFQMNQLARTLNMRDTVFTNPHGLDHMPRKPVSTATDLAKLGRYATNKSAFRFYVSQKSRNITIGGPNGSRQVTLKNTNELLGISDIDGVKTGSTARAGGCLMLSSGRPPESRKEGDSFFITPRRLVVVVLGARDRFGVGLGLVNRGWSLHEQWVQSGRPTSQDRLLR
ncbi:MAG: serine hydrolase [Verrucomicrobiia bacterium]